MATGFNSEEKGALTTKVAALEARIKELEKENDEIRTKIAMGKGVGVGILLILGSIWAFISDIFKIGH